MAWPDRVLGEDEELVLALHPHGRALAGPVLALVLLLGAGGFLLAELPPDPAVRWGLAAVVALLLLRLCVVPWLRWRGARLVLTDERLLLRAGVLRSTVRELPLDDVVDVSTERGPLDRLLGSGTLVLSTVDGEPVVLPAVPDVGGVQRQVWELLDEEQDLSRPPRSP